MANANTLSDEERQFRRRARRRLVGAVVLVTVMVAILPMVLDDKPRPVNPDIAITIPSTSIPGKDAGEFTSKIVPMTSVAGGAKPPAIDASSAPKSEAKPDGSHAKPVVEVPAQQAVVETKQSKAKPASEVAVKQEVVNPKEASKPELAKPKDAVKTEAQKESIAKEGYVVRLGAFADATNAKKRLAELKSRGIKAYAEVVKTPTGEKTRVRAGPFVSQAEAEKVRDKMKAAKVDGDVVNLASEAGR